MRGPGLNQLTLDHGGEFAEAGNPVGGVAEAGQIVESGRFENEAALTPGYSSGLAEEVGGARQVPAAEVEPTASPGLAGFYLTSHTLARATLVPVFAR